MITLFNNESKKSPDVKKEHCRLNIMINSNHHSVHHNYAKLVESYQFIIFLPMKILPSL